MARRSFRFKRVLCAVDFSDASSRAFEVAVRLAARCGARIHVLHVIPRIVASLTDTPITTSKWTADQEKKAKRELTKFKERAAKEGVAATTEVRLGDVDIQILKSAKEHGADLLAMGTHGRKGFELWVLGSVAEWILRHSPIPVLLVGSPGGRRAAPRRRILITTDFSKESGDAIDYGAGIAEASTAIMLLHVTDDRSGALDWSAFPDQSAAIRSRLEALIPSRVKRLHKIEAVVESGKPYRRILKTIKDFKPSLVVLNMHGHGFVHRVLIGSTAERVVRGGAGMCPMLLIPPRSASTSR